MRVALAKYGQETNSFSLTKTTLDTFRQFGLYEREAVLQFGMSAGPFAGLSKACADRGVNWTPIPLIRGWAGASGMITQATHAFFIESICSGLSEIDNLDAVFLDLHGAAQAEHLDDCEGDVIEKCRQLVGKDVPIIVSLDHHANVTERMCREANAIVAHRTQPHDPFDTGYRAGLLLIRELLGEVSAVMALQKVPMITHQEQFLTAPIGPMREWFEKAREFEQDPRVLSVSPCPMQPWLDISEAGWSVIVVTDDEQELATGVAQEMASFAWDNRHRFMQQQSVAPDLAVQLAIESDQFVVLSDTGDSVFGGAPGDSTILLQKLLDLDCPQDCLVPMVDREVVAQAYEIGIGNQMTTRIGGKQDHVFSRPINVECEVLGLGGGVTEVEVIGNHSYDAGRTVLLRVKHVLIAVTETEGIGGNHPVCYEQLGVDVSQAKLAVLKTASNFQYYSGYQPQIVRADTDGMTMSDLVRLPWTRLMRPIFPLDQF